MNLLDGLVILAYIAFDLDFMLQIRRIYHTKSSKDIALSGLTVRLAAIIIFLFKYLTLNSPLLIIGQTSMALMLSVYLILGVVYFRRRTQA